VVCVPGGPVPLGGARDVVQILDPPGRRPPLFPSGSGDTVNKSIYIHLLNVVTFCLVFTTEPDGYWSFYIYITG